MSHRARQVAVVGSINVDTVLRVDTLPVPGQTVMAQSATRYLGGKGANQAAAAARLGATTRMIGACGDDEDGTWALEHLKGSGVDVSEVHQLSHVGTGQATILVADDGENEIVVNAGANGFVEVSDEFSLTDEIVLCQFEIPMETCLFAATHARGPFVINPSPVTEVPSALFELADLVVVNEGEYAAFPQLRHAKQVAITHGADGAELRRDGEVVATATGVDVDQVKSSVGAGDAFCAALAIGLFGDVPAEQALKVACAVGAASVAADASQAALPAYEQFL